MPFEFFGFFRAALSRAFANSRARSADEADETGAADEADETGAADEAGAVPTSAFDGAGTREHAAASRTETPTST